MKELIIFDMDGVLVDSEGAITLAAIEALSEYDIKAEYSDFKQFTGMGDDIFIGGAARLHGAEYDVKMKERAYEIYMATAKDRVQVMPWTKPLLESLHKTGYSLAVASASDRIKVNCNLDCIGIDKKIFSAVITGIDVVRKKPFPDIFLKASEEAGVSAEKCIVIEDALSGIKAAKAANMSCIAVTTSFPYEQLKDAGADLVLDDLLDISNKNLINLL